MLILTKKQLRNLIKESLGLIFEDVRPLVAMLVDKNYRYTHDENDKQQMIDAIINSLKGKTVDSNPGGVSLEELLNLVSQSRVISHNITTPGQEARHLRKAMAAKN